MGTVYGMSPGGNERSELGSLNYTDNFILVNLNMSTLWTLFESQYLVCWCTSVLNGENIVGVIIVLTLNSAYGMGLGII